MEVTEITQRVQWIDKKYIYANDLLEGFNHYADKITTLSLDCFDTLLWRETETPADLFYNLQERPVYQALGINAAQRTFAESQARKMMLIQNGTYEVHLKEIYSSGFPALDEIQINSLVEEEIKLEIETCYAFPPVMEIIRSAKKQGLKIIIVSNTYLQENQLRRLLTHVLPHDVMSAIDAIYCSCDYQLSKNEGLFEKIIHQLNISPKSILHIGDNRGADFEAPSALGINAIHFMQHDNNINELLRLQSNAATVADPLIRYKRALVSPFRGVLASFEYQVSWPEKIVGYASMGPIMYSFARYISDEVDNLKCDGENPKVLFLMRDGYLPYLACEALADKTIGQCIRVSRFSSIAASFYTEEDILNFFKNDTIIEYQEICTQLLLPEEIANHIIKTAETFPNRDQAFIKFILQAQKLILTKSAEYRKKFIRYLQNTAALSPGDTVVLVDLGYIGRTQRALTPILQKEFGINKVVGRYLMTLNTLDGYPSRRGLLEPSWCDDRVLCMLGESFAFIEELCSSCDDSVIDYDDHGCPITAPSRTPSEQIVKVKQIQAECVRFIKDAKTFFKASGKLLSRSVLQDVALIELARRVYLPMQLEIAYLQGFQHDKNKGSHARFCILETTADYMSSLRRQGLLFKNRQPYGWRAVGLELLLTLMTQRRFNLDMNLADLSFRREWLNVILMQGSVSQKHVICATPTHDGYYSLWFSIGKGNLQIAVLFGLNYKSIQLESVELIRSPAFLSDHELQNSQDVSPTIVLNQMPHHSGNLYECADKAASLFISLPPITSQDDHIFRVVYRPIVMQE